MTQMCGVFVNRVVQVLDLFFRLQKRVTPNFQILLVTKIDLNSRIWVS